MVNKTEKRAAVAEVITRETTIHLHKYVHGRYAYTFRDPTTDF